MNEHTRTAINSASESAVLAFGANAQMIKTCEELAELTVQLCKRLNQSPTTDAAIIDEIADATIMVAQMRHLFGTELVDARILYKLDRIMSYIRKRSKLEKESSDKELFNG